MYLLEGIYLRDIQPFLHCWPGQDLFKPGCAQDIKQTLDRHHAYVCKCPIYNQIVLSTHQAALNTHPEDEATTGWYLSGVACRR